MAYYKLSLYKANMFCKQPSAPFPSEFTPLNKGGRALPIQKEDNFTTTNPPPAPKKLLYSAVTKTPIRQQRLHINSTSLNSQNKRKMPVSPDSSISSPSPSQYSTTVVQVHNFESDKDKTGNIINDNTLRKTTVYDESYLGDLSMGSEGGTHSPEI
ncbi:hypothetical protein HHI36_004951 [Cryptolaemus montrouzieri]|uniref:Uncharacterized protein n=1 Tax=Cryptolaemus montrouzieri TaxID=559131 RepID=A0ABD2NT91_9CUCU